MTVKHFVSSKSTVRFQECNDCKRVTSVGRVSGVCPDCSFRRRCEEETKRVERRDRKRSEREERERQERVRGVK